MKKVQNLIENLNNTSNYMKDIEITCEVFDGIPDIIRVLEENGFHYVEEFTLADIYMNNAKTNEFAPKNEKITDTLIIRYVNKNDKKIICKRRNYNNKGLEISTNKSVLKVESITDAEKFLNILGYTRFLEMIDKNYMYESNKYIVYIQEVEELGTFIELESKNKETTVDELIKYLQGLELKIGMKFDIRKAEMLYKKKKEHRA